MPAELLLAHMEQNLFSLFKRAVLAQTPADKLAECPDSDGAIDTVLKAAARVSGASAAATASTGTGAGAGAATPPRLQQLRADTATLCPAATLLPATATATHRRPHVTDDATAPGSARDAPGTARAQAQTSTVGAAVDAHLWSVLLYYALRVTPR